jgi:hypothetical protein
VSVKPAGTLAFVTAPPALVSVTVGRAVPNPVPLSLIFNL